MESINEVIIVSESGTKENNCAMYDLSSGSLLETYKEGHTVQNGLDLIGEDYLISAFEDKAKIKIWQFGQPSSAFRKMTAPGIVTSLAVSKCGQYCIAGVGRVTYIWEVTSGNLAAQLEYHMQDITCVRFTSDGTFFITGGKDGMVFVFFLVEAIMLHDSPMDVIRAHYTWTDHAAEITDIYVGNVGCYSRVATVSNDKTCRIYELDSGSHLYTIHVHVPLTTVTMDMCEYFLFLGSLSGNIYRINLFNMIEAEMHFEDAEKKCAFVGHKKEITSLSVSKSGKYLVSGSADRECRVWDITDFTCIRTHVLSGPVTNVITSRVPPGIKNKKYIPRLAICDFKRIIGDRDDAVVNLANENLSLIHAGAPDQFFNSRVLNFSMDALEKSMVRGAVSLDDLSRVNNEMYSFALNDVFDKATICADESDSSN